MKSFKRCHCVVVVEERRTFDIPEKTKAAADCFWCAGSGRIDVAPLDWFPRMQNGDCYPSGIPNPGYVDRHARKQSREHSAQGVTARAREALRRKGFDRIASSTLIEPYPSVLRHTLYHLRNVRKEKRRKDLLKHLDHLYLQPTVIVRCTIASSEQRFSAPVGRDLNDILVDWVGNRRDLITGLSCRFSSSISPRAETEPNANGRVYPREVWNLVIQDAEIKT